MPVQNVPRRRFVRDAALAMVGAGAGAAGMRAKKERGVRPAPEGPRSPPDPWAEARRRSYAEQGEDIILAKMIERLRISNASYIDIGAYHPVKSSNTFLLYEAGLRGVVVEPNPALTELLRSIRPGDVTLEIGIAARDSEAADYYIIGAEPALNTFSKERAETCGHPITSVVKRPLVGINTVLETHFKSHPSVFSIDIEGLDFEVVGAIRFDRFQPEIFCIETDHLIYDARAHAPLMALMKRRGYSMYAGTAINTIFLRDGYLRDVIGRKG